MPDDAMISATGSSAGAGAPRKGAASRGKLLIWAVLVLAVFAAAAGAFVLLGLGSPGADEEAALSTPRAIATGTVAQTTTPASTGAAAMEAPSDVALDEVFTFRDIFVPLVKPEKPSETSSETSGTPQSTPETSAGTILLQDITVENGERTVVLVWSGKTYSAQAGDQIDDSPWKVLEIGTDSVTMLYGDTQVVLSVGQAISK